MHDAPGSTIRMNSVRQSNLLPELYVSDTGIVKRLSGDGETMFLQGIKFTVLMCSI
jgi:hypothetical protein